MALNQVISKNLRAYLHKSGICNVKDLERLSGVDHGLIYRYMNGYLAPTLCNALRLCKALGITVEQLTEGARV